MRSIESEIYREAGLRAEGLARKQEVDAFARWAIRIQATSRKAGKRTKKP